MSLGRKLSFKYLEYCFKKIFLIYKNLKSYKQLRCSVIMDQFKISLKINVFFIYTW
jgi:hypothetical protein